MAFGEKNRHCGATHMNNKSSRSHAIFRVVIKSQEIVNKAAVRVAHLNLVDLAGSENCAQTGARGQRLKEGGHINKSLLALGTVIAKLSEGESFIPFRDSKLTRILQSSLGGNAKTSMICTITPVAIEESISTLKFAGRAKTIKNCPEVNEMSSAGAVTVEENAKEVVEMDMLKGRIKELEAEAVAMRDWCHSVSVSTNQE
ncbi:hypothetical protein OS493_022657 [Desmophyllum pertusum]|uniref:Kinesin motor domain-containing protein n=1 Tax=Desmophyllum pertusum TaxID=174260 RepID=A0A9W9YM89_9CNID|nr:hypothetical protein OS493_022657 [Desmophyllum pertusum]